MAKEHWIHAALGKHPGALHKQLGVAPGKKIPAAKMQQALHSDSAKEKKRAQAAVNANAWRG